MKYSLSHMKVAIVIPMYQAELSAEAAISLRHLQTYCADFPWIIVHPIGLHFQFDTSRFQKIALSPRHFKSVKTYNRLCLNPRFYQQFLDYDYILIYQLDTCAFKNELAYWCAQGYSYMGAPWLRMTLLAKLKRKILKIPKHQDLLRSQPLTYRWDGVGNGGLSLRHVRHCYETLTAKRVQWQALLKLSWTHQRKKIPTLKLLWLYWQTKRKNRSIADKIRKCFSGGEDRYWTAYGPVFCADFKMPTESVANRFAMEWLYFEVQMKMGGGVLPFAGHGCLGSEAMAMWGKQVEFLS